MHREGIIHRDIKLENILLKEEGGWEKVVIADFGYAVKVPEGGVCEGRVGSRGYTAPEILQGVKYDTKCDIFSLGCLLYSLVCAKHPHYADNM